MPIVAERPQRIIEPAAPKIPSVKPKLPSRNPGLQRAMTNPSYHRNVLRSWTSSTVAVANLLLLNRDAGPRCSRRDAGAHRLIPVGTNLVNTLCTAGQRSPTDSVRIELPAEP